MRQNRGFARSGMITCAKQDYNNVKHKILIKSVNILKNVVGIDICFTLSRELPISSPKRHGISKDRKSFS